MKKYITGKSGFTLIELLIGMTLTIILLSALFALLSVSLTSSRVGKAAVEAQETARVALDAMVREIRMDALDITNPTSNASNVNAISIQVRDKDDPTRFNTVTFHIASNTLYRRLDKWNGTSQNFPITEGTVTALSFNVIHPRFIDISLTVTVPNSPQFTLSTSVAGMNTK